MKDNILAAKGVRTTLGKGVFMPSALAWRGAWLFAKRGDIPKWMNDEVKQGRVFVRDFYYKAVPKEYKPVGN